MIARGFDQFCTTQSELEHETSAEMEIRASWFIITFRLGIQAPCHGHQISGPPCSLPSRPSPTPHHLHLTIVDHLLWDPRALLDFRLQGCSDSFSRFEGLPRAQYRPGDPCELVRQRHDDGVYMRPRS